MPNAIKAPVKNKYFSSGGFVEYPPFKPHQMHVHDRCEIYCVFSGDGHYITEGARHKLEVGRLFLMRPGESHMADLLNTAPYDRTSHHFPAAVVDCIDPERRLLSPFFDRPLGERNVYNRDVLAPTGIYELLSTLHTKKEDEYATELNTTVTLFAILKKIKKLFDAKKYYTPTEETEHMRELVDYVNRHLTDNISIDSICDRFFISRGQLYRNFKNATGSTVWDYITTKRLMLAKSYISDGIRANEAAVSSGFGDYSAFYRAFVKKFGTTPSGNDRS